MILLLDTGILGRLCHPSFEKTRPYSQWLRAFLSESVKNEVWLPEIADYELRREFVRMALQQGRGTTRQLQNLDALASKVSYLPVTSEDWRLAARLWAEARNAGGATAPPEALDGDAILAAQARRLGGVVATFNERHLSQLGVPVHVPEVEAG